MYDLLIRGGEVVDPAQGLNEILDVAIQGNKIKQVAKGIDPKQAKKVIDARGKVVTPGLIDLHCHVYGNIFKNSADPDTAGVKQGVTTVADGGSAGQALFNAFPKYIIPSSRTRVFCFLHLGSQGLSVTPELRDWQEIDLDATAATIEANRGVIKGIKLRLVGNVVASDGLKVVEMAKKTAAKFGLPIMVHIGDNKKQVSPTLTQEFLPMMERGDILSHVFTASFGNVLGADGTVLPELVEARQRGVVLDTALGRKNFSFRVARKCMAQGILPTTLSSDLTSQSLDGPVYGMTVTMSKFLALGLNLEQVVAMSTVNPARALGAQDIIGSLKPGMDADVSILEILSGTWRLVDSEEQTVEATRLIVPTLTIKSGQAIPAKPVGQPKPVS